MAGAAQKARIQGYKGLLYPWEAGPQGIPSTNGFFEQSEHHVAGDVALAFWNRWRATKDRVFLKTTAWPILKGVAEYWVSRVNSTSDGGFKLLNILGPDEWHRKDGEAYNTALASLCLRYAVAAAATVAPEQLNSDNVMHWNAVSKGLHVPVTADGHHQTYTNYSGEAIMQPSVADLGYPLMWPMNISTRKNDLDFYWQKTSGFIVGMTWPMVAIGHKELNDTANAALFTAWAYSTVNPPFMVVSEEPGGAGCPNFVTAGGGVLQMFVAGWGGIRLRDDSVEMLYPQPPPGSTALVFDGLATWAGS
eukprot:SAG31_NODE_569_length_14020_cov_11.049565_9_plen_306_part_00